MRIIAGKYRRRKLLTNPGLTTRPYTDRMKERLFENLGGELHEERVADIFAGTGNIGLESLSRGASSVVFIEKDKHAVELLKENVAKLKLETETFCWKTDVKTCSFRPKGLEQFYPYDLIFFDPPYPMVKSIVPGQPLFRSLQRLAREEISAEDVRLILRTPDHAEWVCPFEWEIDWTLQDSSWIYVLKKSESEGVLNGEAGSESTSQCEGEHKNAIEESE